MTFTSAPLVDLPVTRWRAGVTTRQRDSIAEETPVALEYNGIAHTVMLATPADLEDFAVGFSLSEGLVDRRADIFSIDIEPAAQGITLRLRIAGEAFARLKQRRRGLAGRTGCGLCGVESLAQVARELAPLRGGEIFPLPALQTAIASLPAWQVMQRASGATHAACWVMRDGAIEHPREDVGRHNALDKTLGALVRAGFAPAEGAAIVTSRASFEMVQKAAALGIATLAAVSAPTAAAIRLAERLNVTLIGFLRGDNCVIYSQSRAMQDA